MLISFFIIPSANTAASDNKGGGVDVYLDQYNYKPIEKIYLPYFKTLEAYVNNNAMKQEINKLSGNISFKEVEKLGFDSDALRISTVILLDLCKIDFKRSENTNSIERINNCMKYFSQKNKDYLAATLLTAYELGEFLGADIIIQRAIVNQIYDKIFHPTEKFDYERFETYLINPKDFDKEISKKNTSLITLSNKNLRSANLFYITTKLDKQSDKNIISINLTNNKIRDIKLEELKALEKIALEKNIQIDLSLNYNPLLSETTDSIKEFNKQPANESKIEKDFDLKIKNLGKKVFASLTAISIFSLIVISQLLKKASPLIGLINYKKLQMGIKLGSYLLPLSAFAYLHYLWLKNNKQHLYLRYELAKSTFSNKHVIITY